MSDLISRQAAIDIVSGYAEKFNGYIGSPNDSEVYAYARGLLLGIERNINAVPSAQIEQRWIPVTERLPEPNAVDERGFVKAYLVKTDRHVMMHTARWDGMYWILWGTRTTLADKVTHWMPLPEPPKEETHDNN